jgi:hypothetical protein
MSRQGRLQVRVYEGDVERWRASAEASGMDLSEWVRRALNEACRPSSAKAVVVPAAKSPAPPVAKPEAVSRQVTPRFKERMMT